MATYKIPFAVAESETPEIQTIGVSAPETIAVDGFYIGTEITDIETRIIPKGHVGYFEVEPKYAKDTPCGVFAMTVDIADQPITAVRVPLAGTLLNDMKPASVTINPEGRTTATFTPALAARKALIFGNGARLVGFELELATPEGGNVDQLFIGEIRIGIREPISGMGSLPLSIIMKPGVLRLPIIPALHVLQFTLWNRGTHPITVTGSLVFEDALYVDINDEKKSITPKNLSQRN